MMCPYGHTIFNRQMGTANFITVYECLVIAKLSCDWLSWTKNVLYAGVQSKSIYELYADV